MIKTGLFDKSHLSTLKRAVEVYAQRHQVTTRNIANVETPGYRGQKVQFEEMLDRAGHQIRGTRTHQSHLPIGYSELGDTESKVQDTASDYDNGVNNVDIDEEMTSLATNDLSYRMATRLLSMRYSMLRGAIKGHMR